MTTVSSRTAWPVVLLESVARVVGGSTPDSGNTSYWGGDIVWVTPADLGQLDTIHVRDSGRRITRLGFQSASIEMLPVNSVILSSRAPIGYLAINDVPLCTNQGCKSFVPGASLDTRYLFYFLKRAVPALRELGSGATFAEVSKSKLENYPIPLPPLPEQQRIVGKLDEQMATLDRAQAALDSQSLAVDLAKSGLLCSVLERAASHQTGTASLPSVCDIIMGQSPPGDTYNNLGQGMPFYQGRVDFGELSPATRVWCSSPQKVAEPGDVLLCVRAPVGPTNIASERCCVGRGLAALHCKPMLDPMFLLWTLRAREDEWSKLSAGSTFEAITRTQLDSFTLLVPGKEEQRTIARKMSEQWQLLLDTSNLIAVRSEQLTHLKAALLDAAFSGEI